MWNLCRHRGSLYRQYTAFSTAAGRWYVVTPVLAPDYRSFSDGQQSSLMDTFPALRDGIEGNKSFRNLLQVVPSTPTSSGITLAELKCYDDIFHKIMKGVHSFRGRQFDSNQMHTWFFASMMLQHPFFLDSHPSLKQIEMTA